MRPSQLRIRDRRALWQLKYLRLNGLDRLADLSEVRCSQSSDLNHGAYSYVRFRNYSKKLRQRLEAIVPLLAKSVLCFAIDRIYYGDPSSR